MNITHERAAFINSIKQLAVICCVIFFFTIIVLYWGTGFFLRQVEELQQQLELKVLHRTKALEEVNQQLAREIEEHKLSQKALQNLSEQDMLTGIANRRKFNDYYDIEWNAACRDKRVLSLLMIDIDYFKPYNDKYGHLAGDDALVQVATTLKQSLLRPRDFVARYGGEEFVCLLPETTMSAAIKLAERLRQKIEDLQYIHEFSPAAAVVTISVGIATTIPESSQAKEDLLDQADKALYKAKKDGRNQIKAA
ncbi:MAG: diguanylate cyclase [Desulfuromonas sp.]|nr:diguanylate cyclase [Desulfuromonas sp.]